MALVDELTQPQEEAMAILQDLVGLSGFKLNDVGPGGATVTLLPINIGQRLHVVPYDVLVDRTGAISVRDDGESA